MLPLPKKKKKRERERVPPSVPSPCGGEGGQEDPRSPPPPTPIASATEVPLFLPWRWPELAAAQRPHRCPFLEQEPEPHPLDEIHGPLRWTQRGCARAPPPSPRGKSLLVLVFRTPVPLSAPGHQTPGRERSSRLGLPSMRERGSRETLEGFTPEDPSCATRCPKHQGS